VLIGRQIVRSVTGAVQTRTQRIGNIAADAGKVQSSTEGKFSDICSSEGEGRLQGYRLAYRDSQRLNYRHSYRLAYRECQRLGCRYSYRLAYRECQRLGYRYSYRLAYRDSQRLSYR
jgi:hypothetical protein